MDAIEHMNMAIPTEIVFEWSPDFSRTIRRRYFSRQIRRPCMVFLPIGIIGLLGVLRNSQRGESGGGYWFLICISILPIALWVINHLATGQIRCEGAVPRVSVRIELEGITVKSEKGNSTIKWSAIKMVWKFPEVVLLFWDKKNSLNHAIAVPTVLLGEDTKTFIENKVREYGGQIS